jgi:multiple sugar transport system substrate-binding protein/raffinose/stachyose/melibiose transport system substrate-binding protein
MHHSKFWTFTSLLLVFAFVLAACGQATPPPAVTIEVEKTVEVPVESTVIVTQEVEVIVTQEVEKIVNAEPILYNSYNGDPAPRAFDEQIVADWNAAHPEMPVNHSIIAHEDFKQAIRAYLTATPAPDVLTWFAGNRTRFFIDKGLVYDLSKMWADNVFSDVYAPGFQALASYNDKQYFLPTAFYW